MTVYRARMDGFVLWMTFSILVLFGVIEQAPDHIQVRNSISFRTKVQHDSVAKYWDCHSVNV